LVGRIADSQSIMIVNRQAQNPSPLTTDGSGQYWLNRTIGGKYKILRHIASGGFGNVFEAEHVHTLQRRALKVLHRRYHQDARILEHFMAEARIPASANIVTITDADFAEDGSFYIVMEFLQSGEGLDKIIKKSPQGLPMARAVDITIQAARGVEVAHNLNIIHRDLKPDNLFILKDQDRDLVKVLDWGIAKWRTATGTANSGPPIGCPNYMPPELMLSGVPLVASDIYGLGTILYEMLSGKQAHPGRVYAQVTAHVLTKDPQPLATLRPDLSREICELVARTLDRNPAKRFGSAALLIEALKLALGPQDLLLPPGVDALGRPEAGLPIVIPNAALERLFEPKTEPSSVAFWARWKNAALSVALLLLLLTVVFVVSAAALRRGPTTQLPPRTKLPPTDLSETRATVPVPPPGKEVAASTERAGSEAPRPGVNEHVAEPLKPARTRRIPKPPKPTVSSPSPPSPAPSPSPVSRKSHIPDVFEMMEPIMRPKL